MDAADESCTADELQALLGRTHQIHLEKSLKAVDEYARAFLAMSTFLTIASCSRDGKMDVSPKGDPAGFVRVLDDRTLAIPERPGNRRADTFNNVLTNPSVGLIFLVPEIDETLRVNGTASHASQSPDPAAVRQAHAYRAHTGPHHAHTPAGATVQLTPPTEGP